MMCSASSYSRGPHRVNIIVVMGAESKGGLSSKPFPILDAASLKENINETLELRGTLVEGPTPGLVDEEVEMTSILTIICGAMIATAAPSKLPS